MSPRNAHKMMTGPVKAAMTAIERADPARAAEIADLFLKIAVNELDNATSGRQVRKELECA